MGNILLFVLAIRNQTCLRLKRRRRRDLLGIPVEIHIVRQDLQSPIENDLTTPMTYLGFPSGSSPVQVSTLLKASVSGL